MVAPFASMEEISLVLETIVKFAVPALLIGIGRDGDRNEPPQLLLYGRLRLSCSAGGGWKLAFGDIEGAPITVNGERPVAESKNTRNRQM